MNPTRCESCGHEFDEWVEFCPDCSEPIKGYARPAGFWIRVGAHIIDSLIFIPLGVLGFFNGSSWKSVAVLVLINVPWFFYKPLMESFCGATLGKMACGVKVIDAAGKKLSLVSAYVRYFPSLICLGVSLVGQVILYSSEQFQLATTTEEAKLAQQENFLTPIVIVLYVLATLECVFAAFTYRKRALHDMLAESFCVYKES